MEVYIAGVGVVGPGLHGWAQARPILSGQQPHRDRDLPILCGAILPAAERRRSTQVTRLALEAASQAVPHGTDPAAIATVFASSGGEVEVIHHILSALSESDRQISPTRFHNSVHNTASGYWSIAVQSRQPSLSLSCFDDSFGAGLLEAVCQTLDEDIPVLLVAYDTPPLEPVFRFRPLIAPCATALLVSGQRMGGVVARLSVEFAPTPRPPTVMQDPDLELLRTGNPAARSLPLLAAIAAERADRVVLGCGMTGALLVAVEPCC